VSAQEQTSIKAASSYSKDGITFASPDQADWKLLTSEKAETVFEKRANDEILNASVKTIETKTFETDKDLLAGLEALKEDELSKLKRDSLHYYHTRFKGVPCVQYDGIFNPDAGSGSLPKFKFFNFKGYLCPHPQTKGKAIQLEFSNYSNTRGFPDGFADLSDKFFEKIVLPKAAAK
jgi:hypothetical protein